MALNRKIAWINLTSGKVKTGSVSLDDRQKFIGGRGLGTYLLYNHSKPGVDALSPDNVVVISTGLLAGTPGSAECPLTVSTKSPLTGSIEVYSGSSQLSTEMRWAGFDHLVISGRSHQPVYLFVHNGKITVSSASGLQGKTINETQQIIREELHDRNIRIMAIGPAGEKQVRLAGVFSGPGETDSGAGIGTVFGSKNLKAIAVRGTMDITLAHPKASLEFNYQPVPQENTPVTVSEKLLDSTKQPSVEAASPYRILLKVLKEEKVDDRYGLGLTETANILAWIIDLSEQYIITEKDTDNLDITWDNAPAVRELVRKIAEKQGFGSILAEGAFLAAERIGKISVDRLMYIGRKIIYPEQALTPVMVLNKATTGNDCSRLASIINVGALSEPVFRQTAWYQNLSMAAESLGTCRFPKEVSGLTAAGCEGWAKSLSLATGLEMTPEAIWTAAERAITIERLFNLREGVKENPVSKGVYKKMVDQDSKMNPVIFDTMLKDYYRYRGWDETGNPANETLKKLALDREPSHLK